MNFPDETGKMSERQNGAPPPRGQKLYFLQTNLCLAEEAILLKHEITMGSGSNTKTIVNFIKKEGDKKMNFDFSFVPQYIPYYLQGVKYTLLISLITVLVISDNEFAIIPEPFLSNLN